MKKILLLTLLFSANCRAIAPVDPNITKGIISALCCCFKTVEEIVENIPEDTKKDIRDSIEGLEKKTKEMIEEKLKEISE